LSGLFVSQCQLDHKQGAFLCQGTPCDTASPSTLTRFEGTSKVTSARRRGKAGQIQSNRRPLALEVGNRRKSPPRRRQRNFAAKTRVGQARRGSRGDRAQADISGLGHLD
jgi:hypothetical protein